MALPVLVHLHMELQKGALGQLEAHGGAHRLEHRAPMADDDALLGLALDQDLAADARPLHSVTVAIECGSSSRATASSCSRTSSATQNASRTSVTVPSG